MLKKWERLAENILGIDIYGFQSKIIQVVPQRKRRKAWFSYPSIMRSIIDEYQIDLIFDVGANKGQFALEVRELYKGPIISFEPVSGAFTELKRNASSDKNWFVFRYALGNESKEQYINVYRSDDFSSLLEINKYCVERFKENIASPVKELIQIRRLDDIVGEFPFNIYEKKILLKMDTQGYDLEVFRGATSILKNLMAIQSEVSQRPIYHDMPHWTESIDNYEKAGFTLAGLFPVSRDGLQYIESDCLMVKA
jgi:FkbM family methyltransferase